MSKFKKIKVDMKEESSTLFKGKCAFCGHKVKKEKADIKININMFNEEYSFMHCPSCKGNMAVRLSQKHEMENI